MLDMQQHFLFVNQPVRCDLNLSWLYIVVLGSCPYARNVIKLWHILDLLVSQAAKII